MVRKSNDIEEAEPKWSTRETTPDSKAGDFFQGEGWEVPTTLAPESAHDPVFNDTVVMEAIYTGIPGVLEAALMKIGSKEGAIKALISATHGGRTPVMHAALRGNLEKFNEVLAAMEARLSPEQLKTALTTTTWHNQETLIMAAAEGGNEKVFERVVNLLDGAVLEVAAQQQPSGSAVVIDAARNGCLSTFKTVVNILSSQLTRGQAHDMVRGDDTVLTSAALRGNKHIVAAWAETLLPKLPYCEMAKACTASFAQCARNPSERLPGISALIAYGAEVTHEDLIRLANAFPLDDLKECFVDVLSMADNPFIPGMTLAVAFDDAAPKAPERESRILLSLMDTIDDILLEVLERLPQTMGGFSGGVDGCAAVFEPELDGTRPVDFSGPLQLALNERQYTETFCVAPVVFEYLSREFVAGLPNMLDTDDVLGPPSGKKEDASCDTDVLGVPSGKANEDEYSTRPRNGRDYLYNDGLVANGTLARLMQGMGLPASQTGGLLARLTGWGRIFGGTLLPGAQFVAVGVLTKPTTYYNVSAMRMVLDFVVHLTMLALYTNVVIEDDDGSLSKSEIVLTFHVTAAIWTEITEMWGGLQEYWQDKWNWLDVLSLILLSAGLYVRIFDGDKHIGRMFYALSAPLIFSRFLFFAQILPRQGLVIQMITIMLGEIVHFGVVMGVIMVGFTVSFLALFQDTAKTFFSIWLDIFHAMLGEVEVFEDVSHVPKYDGVATFLLALYLVIMAVMMLNLLIAVLSTEHAKVAERSDREYVVSKVRMIKLYRRVLAKDLLPPPFNLVQLAILLPFLLVDRLCNVETRSVVRRGVGVSVFWFVAGPLLIFLGWVLWTVSIPRAMIVAWKGSNHSGTSLPFRILCCSVVLPFHFYGAPIVLAAFWIQSAVAGVCSLFRQNTWARYCCSRPGVAGFVTPGNEISHYKRANVSVMEMLRKAPGGLSVRGIWEYLEDPNTPTSPAMRRDEQCRPSTVEHVRLLRNHLEATAQDGVERLCARLESADGAMEARVRQLEQLFDKRFMELDQHAKGRVEDLETTVERIIEEKLHHLERKLDLLMRRL